MGMIQGALFASNSYDLVADSLYLQGERVYRDEEDGLAQVFPNFESFNQQGTGQTPNFEDSGFFSVYSHEDMQNRINVIRQEMLLQQNAVYFAGKCLRSFTAKVAGRLSGTACGLAQLLDIRYMEALFRIKRYRRCESEKTAFCKKVKEANLLKAAEDELTYDIEPAEELLAHSIGVKKDKLFKREELYPENSIRTVARSSKQPIHIKV